ncbi:MAG: 30S ribosomal protein S9 [Patescibacteria group bacterium]
MAITKKEKEKYIEAVGRRKTAVARVRLFSGRKAASKTPELVVNDLPFSEYFPTAKLQKTVLAPFSELSLKEYHATVLVGGSGLSSQAEAIRLGLSRALVALNPTWRSKLKSLGFMKRDPRKVERKKYGLRKARRPQQWRKR